MKRKAEKLIWLFAIALTLQTSVRAGTVIIYTSPASQQPSSTQPWYLAISKWDGANSGVTISSTYTNQTGNVSGWNWSFPKGTPSTSTSENPGKVTFSSSLYGSVSACTIGLNHTGSKGESCTSNSKVISTLNVSMVAPNLVFSTGGSWSPSDTAVATAESGYNVTLNKGQVASFQQGGDTEVGVPYEYQFTISNPSNSGALGSKMNIVELGSSEYDYYTGSTLSSTLMGQPRTGFYGPVTPSYYCDTSVTFPANPEMFAVDFPGFDLTQLTSAMSKAGYTKVIATFVLTSTPLYDDPADSEEDGSTKVTQTFTYTVTGSNGSYSVSVTP